MHSLGLIKSMEDRGIPCQQDHQGTKSPPGANDRKKTVHGAQNLVKHTWTVCEIAVVINHKDSISGLFNS